MRSRNSLDGVQRYPLLSFYWTCSPWSRALLAQLSTPTPRHLPSVGTSQLPLQPLFQPSLSLTSKDPRYSSTAEAVTVPSLGGQPSLLLNSLSNSFPAFDFSPAVLLPALFLQGGN